MPRFKPLIHDQHILWVGVGDVELCGYRVPVGRPAFEVGIAERSAGSDCSIRVSAGWSN
jgi:hypothetical protein